MNFALPIAIIIAGLAIGAGIYFTGSKTPTNTANQNTNTQITPNDIVMPPVSPSDHIIGNPNATITVVEYSDLECPFCKTFHVTMHKIIDNYGKDGSVAWVYRQMPLEQLHSKAPNESLASECVAGISGNETFWKYIDGIYAITPSNNGLDQNKLEVIANQVGVNIPSFRDCMTKQTYKSKVDAEYQDGFIATGGRPGTPFNILVLRNAIESTIKTKLNTAFAQSGDVLRFSPDGKRIVVAGALPYEAMKFIIDTLLGK
jgi:protein-disulfide isomerase